MAGVLKIWGGSLLLMLFFLSSSCKKETFQTLFHPLALATQADLYALTPIYNSSQPKSVQQLFIAGGERWSSGFVAQSDSGFINWSSRDIGNKAFLCAQADSLGQLWLSGIDGNVWYKKPNETDFTLLRTYLWGQLQCIAPLHHSQSVLLGGGAAFKNGLITQIHQEGAQELSRDSFKNEVRCFYTQALPQNSGTNLGALLFAGGYGAIWQSANQGQNWAAAYQANDLITQIAPYNTSLDNPTPDFLMALGLDGTLHKYQNGNWSLFCRPKLFKSPAMYGITFVPTENGTKGVMVGDNGAVFVALSAPDTWIEVTGLPESANWRAVWANAERVYLVGLNGQAGWFEW